MKNIVTITAIVILLLLGIIFSPMFKISNINIEQNQSCINADEIKDKSQGQYIFLLNSEKLKTSLLTKTCLKSIRIKKILPNTLFVKITSTKTVARLEDNTHVLNEDGSIQQTSNTSLPIFYDTKLTNPTTPTIEDPLILKSLKIVSGILSSDFQATSIRIVDGDLAVYNQDAIVVIFSLIKDENIQVDSLQQVLAKTKIDATKIAKIDLRFDKPIILFK